MMCAYSVVMDHYKPIFEPFDITRPVQGSPLVPPYGMPPQPAVDLAELARLIAEFREAAAAAKTVDRLTGQSDCEDPDKAKLEQRVTALEAELARIRKAAPGLFASP
jgi:hypothetical protein